MSEILVVDDDSELGETVGLLLEQAGHRARVVRSLEDALRSVRRSRPDVVLADFQMPGGGARDLRTRLPRRIPVVVMTGLAKSEVGPGFAAVLPKPFAAEHLLDAVSLAQATAKPLRV